MKWITHFFCRMRSALDEPERKSRNFLRLISPSFDQSFQLAHDFSLESAREAQKRRGYFFFRTQGGRRVTVNFANIHAMQFSEWYEIDRNTYDVKGIRIYFPGDEEPLEVPATSEEISTFFSDLASESVTAQLGQWTVEKTRLVLAVASSEFGGYNS